MRIVAVGGLAVVLSACGSQVSSTTSVSSAPASPPSAAASSVTPSSSTSSPSAASTGAFGPVSVTYRVTGIGSKRALQIGWKDATGASQQLANQTLPWSLQISTNAAPAVLDVKNADAGAVMCEILIDGKVVASDTGSGPYQSAHCTAALPN